jgi:hypothetical protein
MEDLQRGETEQCHSMHSVGRATYLFCELRVNHTGKHMNYSREWEGDAEHPVARAIRARAKKRSA